MKFLFISQIYLIILFVITNLVLESRYETIDDLILSDLISGQYTGKSESHLIFISDFLGFLIKFFNNGNFNIYAFLQIILLILIISMYFYFENNSFFKIINFVSITIIIIILSLRPSYTITALVSSILLVKLLTNPKIIFSNLNKFILVLFLILSISIRYEVLYLNVLFFISFMILNFIQFKKNYFNKYILVLISLLTSFFVNSIFERYFYNSAWNQYNKWNLMRHQIHNRISQFKLDQIILPNGWSPYEHNLFVDWAYGDQKIFDIDWLNIAYEFTKSYRSFESIFHHERDYFLFNIERYNFISNWAILFILLIGLSFFIFYQINKKYFILMVLIYWSPSIIFFIYSGFFLLLPDRVVLPLLIVNIFLLLGLNKSKLFSEQSLIIFLIYILLVLKIFQIHSDNKTLKNKNTKIIYDLKSFNINGIYFIPGCENPYLSEDPYKLLNKRIVKILNVGCWDTFSPHWYQKKFNFNLLNLSAYDDLFENNVYWLSKSIPDTSLNIELLLKENGRQNINRSKIKSISGEYEIYKFTQN